jgi:hypothetical protein
MRLPNNVDQDTTTQILQKLASYTAVTLYDFGYLNGWWLGLNCLDTLHSWIWQDGSPLLPADTRLGGMLPAETYDCCKCAFYLYSGYSWWSYGACDFACNRVVCESTSRLPDGYRGNAFLNKQTMTWTRLFVCSPTLCASFRP